MKKICTKCDKNKPLYDYYKHPRSSDGYQPLCKECHKIAVKANRKAKEERYREYDRMRSQKPHRVEQRKAYEQSDRGKEALNRGRKAYIERNPKKKYAHDQVAYAVRIGRLVKQPCEDPDCNGKSRDIHAHHDDYAKPLEVRWLCFTCHMRWHRDNGPGLNGDGEIAA